VVARRQPDRPGSGIVFLAPVKGRKATAAAVAGLAPTAGVAALRLEGPDRPGLGSRITGAIADTRINLRGLPPPWSAENSQFIWRSIAGRMGRRPQSRFAPR